MTVCSICIHPQRAAIDADFATGKSHRAIARTYGLSLATVGRHLHPNHVTREQRITGLADTVDAALVITPPTDLHLQRELEETRRALAHSEAVYAELAAHVKGLTGVAGDTAQLKAELLAGLTAVVHETPRAVSRQDLDPDERKTMTHIVIPDTQVKPGVPTDHLTWIGTYIAEQYSGKRVRVIHLGDHWDMPSLSHWDKGKLAIEGRRVVADIAAGNDGFAALTAPLTANFEATGWMPEDLVFFEGNHEDRITRAVQENPQLEGFLGLDLLDVERAGWRRKPFLVPEILEGVSYAHYFYNPMTGKPYGGSNIETRLKTIGTTFTMGHQQTLMYGLRFVAGKSQHGLVAGACYLHDEDYKGPQGNAHWRGIIVKHEVRDGSYDPMFVSLDYLCRRYEGVALSTFLRKKYPKLAKS